METVIGKYKYYVWTDDDSSEENILFAASLDIAMEFINNLLRAMRRGEV